MTPLLLLLLLCCCFRKPEPELHAAKHTTTTLQDTTTLAFVAAGYGQTESERTAGSFACSLLPRSHSFPMVQKCYFIFWHLEKNAFYNSGTSVPITGNRCYERTAGPFPCSLLPRSHSFPMVQNCYFTFWHLEENAFYNSGTSVPITENKVPWTDRWFFRSRVTFQIPQFSHGPK